MKAWVLLLFCLLPVSSLLAATPGGPSTASGPSALALAASVALYSPVLRQHDKDIMARLFDGNLNFKYPPDIKITVAADSIVCRVSNVDITSRSCDLTFANQKHTITGRQANEINSMLAEVGIPPDGAAGTIYEAAYHLTCTIDPTVIKQKGGGGADCTFSTQQ